MSLFLKAWMANSESGIWCLEDRGAPNGTQMGKASRLWVRTHSMTMMIKVGDSRHKQYLLSTRYCCYALYMHGPYPSNNSGRQGLLPTPLHRWRKWRMGWPINSSRSPVSKKPNRDYNWGSPLQESCSWPLITLSIFISFFKILFLNINKYFLCVCRSNITCPRVKCGPWADTL